MKMSDNKKPVMLCLEPNDVLVFKGPLHRFLCKNVVIGNPSSTQSVAFKLKTTSSHMFLVRPHIGVLGPDEKVTLDIFLKPTVPDSGQKRPKFLIQAAVASGDVTDVKEFWRVQKSAIWEAKIECDLVLYKSSEGKQDGEKESETHEVSEPVAKLLKQHSGFKEESSVLGNKDKAAGRTCDMMRPSLHRSTTFIFASCMAIVAAAIVGALYGKHYL